MIYNGIFGEMVFYYIFWYGSMTVLFNVFLSKNYEVLNRSSKSSNFFQDASWILFKSSPKGLKLKNEMLDYKDQPDFKRLERRAIWFRKWMPLFALIPSLTIVVLKGLSIVMYPE